MRGSGLSGTAAVILRGDARNLPLPDASVDLIVTSPPYFGLRSYQDGGGHYDGQIGAETTPEAFLEALWECTREWIRVLKPGGSLWLNLGDKYSGWAGDGTQNGLQGGRPASRHNGQVQRRKPKTLIPAKSLMGLPWRYALGCVDDLGLTLRAEVIWSKPNGLPDPAKDRVSRSHEQWFHLVKQPRYFALLDETRNLLGKQPDSVWEIATQPLKVPDSLGIKHFAAFPMEFPRRIILGWSPPSGVVLDPLGGTGTTALVASALGRRGISVDMSADYCRIAQWRTTDPGERARALGVPKPPVQAGGQTDLFGDGVVS